MKAALTIALLAGATWLVLGGLGMAPMPAKFMEGLKGRWNDQNQRYTIGSQ